MFTIVLRSTSYLGSLPIESFPPFLVEPGFLLEESRVTVCTGLFKLLLQLRHVHLRITPLHLLHP
jgi:hypothetical protein